MAQFIKNYVQDLAQDIQIRHCGTLIFNTDSDSNVINVSLYNGQEEAPQSGSVACAVICSDGSTVPVTGGTISGNTVSVTLGADGLIPGQVGIGIQVISGDVKTTVFKAVYSVELFETDTVVDPSSRITISVGELVSDIESAVASIPADYSDLLAAIAPTFGTSTAYASGSYVWYSGHLYRFTAAHSAGAWIGTDATQVALANDVSDLKSALNADFDQLGRVTVSLLGFENIALIRGQRIEISTTEANDLIPSPSTGYSSVVKQCSEGDVFTCELQTATGWKAIAFLTEEKTYISGSQNAQGEFTAPESSAYVVFNTRNENSTNTKSNYYVFMGSLKGDESAIRYLGTYAQITNHDANNAITKNGFYIFASHYVSNIPVNDSSIRCVLEVFLNNTNPTNIYQRLTCTNGEIYFRRYSNSTFDSWVKISGQNSNVKACIIGASVEAGTTHETASSGAVVNPAKAYLTVALENNGVTVTNKSHGGMGYLRTASDSTVFKDLIDNTDFSTFDSVYLALGGNDWNYDKELGNKTDTGITTVCGMLKYAIEKILTSNAYIKIFVKTPGIRATKGDFSTLWGWNAQNSATVPYSLKDLHNKITEVCEMYSVEVIQSFGHEVANAYNVLTVLPDGVHPSQKTMALMADNMTGRISFR